MKIVITGATGFLGGHTLSKFRHYQLNAIGTSRFKNDPANNIYTNFDSKCDVLVHFSESNNRFQVNEMGKKYIETIKEQTHTLLKSCTRIVYASSIAVYPDKEDSLRKPNDTLVPFDTYSEAKLLVENMVLNHSSDSVVARIANAYGPNMSDLNLISSILKQIQNKKPIVEVISSTPVRDYIWHSDITEAIYKMVQLNSGGVFNVATGVGYSVEQVCCIAGEVAGHTNFQLMPKMNVPFSKIVMDISSTIATLDWRPHISLREGLTSLIKGIK